jgi:hypothetical protein
VKNPLGTAEEFANKSSDQTSHQSGGRHARSPQRHRISPLRRHPGDARDDAGAVGMFADRTEGAHGVIADFVTR